MKKLVLFGLTLLPLILLPSGWNLTPALAQQVTVSGPVTLSGQVKMDAVVTSSPPLFTDGFESGNCNLWDERPWGCNTGDINVNTNRVHSGTYSLEIHYAAGAGSDVNRWIGYTVSPTLTTIHLRGYVNQKTPTGEIDGVQRKLIWFSNDVDSTLFSNFLNTWSASGTMALAVSINSNATCDIQDTDVWADDDLFTLNYDTWYAIEWVVQLNTPHATGGPYDGEYWLYVNGDLKHHGTGKVFRGSCSQGYGMATVGRQTQGDQATDELRYWDDIAISTGYIGP